MWRAIAGVIGGYVVMALLVFATFSAAYLLMGAEAAFKPGSYEVSGLWVVVSFVLGLAAAVAGGYACAAIARGGRAPMALAALVLVLGVLLAVPALTSSDDGRDKTRSGDVPNLEAMQNAKEPKWAFIFNPLVGAAGVLLGAGLRNKRRPFERARAAR